MGNASRITQMMRAVESPGLWQKRQCEVRSDHKTHLYELRTTLRYAVQLLNTPLERRLTSMLVTIGPPDNETLDL